MDCILREKLLNQAQALSRVSAIYRVESSRFVEAYFNWLESAEKDLSGLRSPFSVLLQSEKTKVASVIDGYLPDDVQAGSRSIRRTQRAVAAQSLAKISQDIYSKIEQVDHEFNQIDEKICHALAVLAGKDISLFDIKALTESEVTRIWNKLAAYPDTLPMYNYLSVKLAVVDRNYLFMNALQNILDNQKMEKKGSDNKNTAAKNTKVRSSARTVSKSNNTVVKKAVGKGSKKNSKEVASLETVLTSLLGQVAHLKLKENSFSELLAVASTIADRKKLSKSSRVDEADILLLAKCADLQRVTGLTFPLAYVLVAIGIDSVVELSRRNANSLEVMFTDLVNTSGYEIQVPDVSVLQNWITEAGDLPRRLHF